MLRLVLAGALTILVLAEPLDGAIGTRTRASQRPPAHRHRRDVSAVRQRRRRRVQRLRRRHRARDCAGAARRGGARQRQFRWRLSRAPERHLRRWSSQRSPSRRSARATMLFSDPYIAAGQQIAVRSDSAIAGPDNLAGRTVGVQINTTAQFAMEKRPGRDAREIQHDRSGAAGFEERARGRRGERRPGAALHGAQSFPGLKTVGGDTRTSSSAWCSRRRATICGGPSTPRCGGCRTAANTRRSTRSGSASSPSAAPAPPRRVRSTPGSSRARGRSSCAASG